MWKIRLLPFEEGFETNPSCLGLLLKNEKTSNNKSDSTFTLLTISGIQRLTLKNKSFECSPEEVLSAFNQPCSLFEDQALQYFSGYVIKKMLEKFRGKASDCDTCSKFGKKICGETRGLTLSGRGFRMT